MSNNVSDNINDNINDNIKNNINVINSNLVETNIRFYGDVKTITQIVQLLAYIRHAIKYNLKTDINVKICHNIINTPLVMDVNEQEISDYITQSNVEIN